MPAALRRFRIWGIGLLAAALAVAVLLPAGAAPSRPLFDWFQRMSPVELDGKVAVVLIDDDSISEMGPWPWPRYYMANLVERLNEAGATVIGLDMIFPERDRFNGATIAGLYPELPPQAAADIRALPSMDSTFSQAIGAAPVVAGRVGIAGDAVAPRPSADAPAFSAPLPPSVAHYARSIDNLEEIDAMVVARGLINGAPEDDGVVRRIPVAARVGGADTSGLATAITQVALGGEPPAPAASNGNLRGIRLGGRFIPLDADGSAILRFGDPKRQTVISAVDLFRANFRKHMVTDRIVVVGLGAAGTSDIVTTPFGPHYGVMIQAQAVEALIDGHILARPDWGRPLELGLGIALALMAIIGAAWLRGYALPLAPMIVAATLAASWLSFDRAQLLLDPVLPLGMGMAAGLAVATVKFAETARARAEIHRAFDRYLSPELVDRIARDPSALELGGEERDMTVMFCDIRGFSALSEQMSPNEIIQFLIGFLTPMTDILLGGRATIDKYVGDAIIAFWNAPLDDPHHAENAANAALAMIERLVELNATMPAEGRYPWPGTVRIGIGLNAGRICVGNMGSEHRLNYSMIGDAVNLASRIEGLTKYYGVEAAIGDALARRLDGYALLELDRVRVVGREQPETVHALIGGPAVRATEAFAVLAERHAILLAAYRAMDWNQAEAALVAMEAAGAPYLGGRLFDLYRDRIAHYRAFPPGAEWDGVFQATEK